MSKKTMFSICATLALYGSTLTAVENKVGALPTCPKPSLSQLAPLSSCTTGYGPKCKAALTTLQGVLCGCTLP